MCKDEGVAPEKPIKGSFNLRVGAALHQRVAIAATQRGMTLNKYIVEVPV